MKINVHELSARDLNDGYAVIFAMVEVSGMAQLDSIISKLKKINGVLDIIRSTN